VDPPTKSIPVLTSGYTSEELSGLKLVLASREYTLVERSNQLLRMMGELGSKDHELATGEPIKSCSCGIVRPKELEVQLADIHKGQMQEANGVHASICLLVDTEKECQQLHRRCRFWRSQALAKPNLSGGAPRNEHLG
jgi:hypothetical protein